jgi:hypothetical protein
MKYFFGVGKCLDQENFWDRLAGEIFHETIFLGGRLTLLGLLHVSFWLVIMGRG